MPPASRSIRPATDAELDALTTADAMQASQEEAAQAAALDGSATLLGMLEAEPDTDGSPEA
jgi:hypothetical protein